MTFSICHIKIEFLVSPSLFHRTPSKELSNQLTPGGFAAIDLIADGTVVACHLFDTWESFLPSYDDARYASVMCSRNGARYVRSRSSCKTSCFQDTFDLFPARKEPPYQ
jgi:hypothetical protein